MKNIIISLIYNDNVMSIICIFLIIAVYTALSVLCKKGFPKFKLKKWQCCLILAVIAAVFSLVRIYNGHDWGGDFSCYIAQAKSILSGKMTEQVSVNNYIVSNSNVQIGPAAYPWGYPLMLASVIKLFGVNFIALKVFNVLMFVLTVLIFYKFVSEKLSGGAAFFSSLTFAFFPLSLDLTDMVISDTAYVLFSVASVYAIDRFFTGKSNRMFCTVITSLTCFSVFFVRTVGIVSFLTVLLTDVVLFISKKSRFLHKYIIKFNFSEIKPIEHIVFYVLFCVPVVISKLVFPSGDAGYAYYFKNFSFYKILVNCGKYVFDFSDLFHSGKVLAALIFVSLAILAVFGIIKSFSRHFHIVVFCAGVLAAVIIFPEYQGLRYLSALMPWLFLFVFESVDYIKQKLQENNSEKYLSVLYKLGCTVIALIICTTFRVSMQCVTDRAVSPQYEKTNRAYTEDALNMYDYIAQNTSEDDIIEFFRPRVLWLNTERKSIVVDEKNAEMFNDIDYILRNSNSSEYIVEKIKNSENITLEYQNGTFKLYKVNR